MSQLPAPTLTGTDQANVQTATTSAFGLDGDSEISWVLYSEGRWSEWQQGLVDAGLTQYASGYDGYTFLFGLSFTDLASPGDILGLGIELPNQTGFATEFGWFLTDAFTYQGYSVYRDDVNDVDIFDTTWLCDTVDDPEDENYNLGYCYNFLPTSSGPDAAYRFSKKDLVNVYGWTNFSGEVNTFAISSQTVLLGAFTLAAQVTAVVATALALSF